MPFYYAIRHSPHALESSHNNCCKAQDENKEQACKLDELDSPLTKLFEEEYLTLRNARTALT